MQPGSLVKVTTSFQTDVEDELSLLVGDLIQVKEIVDKYWLCGVANCQTGKFPKNYVTAVELPDFKSDEMLFVAFADFLSAEQGDLRFSRGDIIIGESAVDANWWRGRRSSLFTGIFPLSHVWQVDMSALSKARQSDEPQDVRLTAKVSTSLKKQLDDEIDLKQGEIVTITKIIDKDWYWGETGDGRAGRFPKGFVVLLEDVEANVPIVPPPMGFTNSPLGQPKTTVEPSPQPQTSSIMDSYASSCDALVEPYGRTKFPFSSQYPNELSFGAGQIVKLLRHIDDEWTEGELNGQVGLFPTEFVDIVVDCPPDCEPRIEPGTMGRVLYEFDTGVEGELRMRQGEVVILLEQINKDWYRARSQSGEIGICPCSYVEVVDNLNLAASSSSSSNIGNKTGSPISGSGRFQRANSLPAEHVKNGGILDNLNLAPTTIINGRNNDDDDILRVDEVEGERLVSSVEWHAAVGDDSFNTILEPEKIVSDMVTSESKSKISNGTKLDGGSKKTVTFGATTTQGDEDDFQWDFGDEDTAVTSSSSSGGINHVTGSGGGAGDDHHHNNHTHRHRGNNHHQQQHHHRHHEHNHHHHHKSNKQHSDLKRANTLDTNAVRTGFTVACVHASPGGASGAAGVLPSRAPPPIPAEPHHISNSRSHNNDAATRIPQRAAPPTPLATTSSSPDVVDAGDTRGNSEARGKMEDQRKLDDKRRKRGEYRQCVITEMTQTERDYNKDLKTCYDVYLRDPTRARELGIDIVTLFGNLDEVIEISSRLLKSIEDEARNEESSQMIGHCFVDLISDLKDVYGHYCRNHDDVNDLLTKYKSNTEIWSYLQDGVLRMQDTTNCFDLPSVLIKPVQRILKYPLLIDELEKVTDENHPDKVDLMQAMDLMSEAATSINEFKRRKDLVFKYRKEGELTLSRRLAKINLHSVLKKSSRMSVKLSSSLGFTTVEKDEAFEQTEQSFHLLEKNVKVFLKGVKDFCSQQAEVLQVAQQLSEEISEFYAEHQSRAEVEQFKSVQHDIYTNYWVEFNASVTKTTLSPLTSLLELFMGPSKLIAKRQDKLFDLAACSSRLEKNRDFSKQKQLEAEQLQAKNMYNALNSQLLDELPQLCTIALEIFRSAVEAFLRARRMFIGKVTRALFALMELPLLKTTSSSDDVIETFRIKHHIALQNFTQLTILQHHLFGGLMKGEGGGSGGGKGGSLPRSSSSKRNSTLTTSIQTSQQTEVHRASLYANYAADKMFEVGEEYVPSDALDLPLHKGDIVAVIKQGDPSGSRERWFVDNGASKGFVPRRILTPVLCATSAWSPAHSSSLAPSSSTAFATPITSTSISPSAPLITPPSGGSNASSNGGGSSSGVSRNCSATLIPSSTAFSDRDLLTPTTSRMQSPPSMLPVSLFSGGVAVGATTASTSSTFGEGGILQPTKAVPSMPVVANSSPFVSAQQPQVAPHVPTSISSSSSSGISLPGRSPSVTGPKSHRDSAPVPLLPLRLSSNSSVHSDVADGRRSGSQTRHSSGDPFSPVVSPTEGAAVNATKPLQPIRDVGSSEKMYNYTFEEKREGERYCNVEFDPLVAPTVTPVANNTRRYDHIPSDPRTPLNEFFYAQYEFSAAGASQLSLARGQVVRVIYTCDLHNNSEWWFVEDRYKNQGYAPAAYLKKYGT